MAPAPTPSPDRTGQPVELTVAPPRGLEVHVAREERGDGPFRVTALTRTVVGLRVDRGWRRPVGRFFWWPVAATVACTVASIVALGMFGAAAVGWIGAAMAAVWVGSVAHEVHVRRRSRARVELLAIERETDSLVVPGLPPFRLADIETVEVASRVETYPPGQKITSHELRVFDVMITTPAGMRPIATTETAEQAGHVRDLIEAARSKLSRSD